MQIEKVYEPQRFEPHWANWWIESGIFHAATDATRPRFSMVIPPPNVTGALHMGHMLDHTIMDTATRGPSRSIHPRPLEARGIFVN
jgi:valyl-tRNA synthetase